MFVGFYVILLFFRNESEFSLLVMQFPNMIWRLMKLYFLFVLYSMLICCCLVLTELGICFFPTVGSDVSSNCIRLKMKLHNVFVVDQIFIFRGWVFTHTLI